MYKFQAILWLILSLKCPSYVYIIKTPLKRSVYCYHSYLYSLWVVITSKFTEILIEKGVVKNLALIAQGGRGSPGVPNSLARYLNAPLSKCHTVHWRATQERLFLPQPVNQGFQLACMPSHKQTNHYIITVTSRCVWSNSYIPTMISCCEWPNSDVITVTSCCVWPNNDIITWCHPVDERRVTS